MFWTWETASSIGRVTWVSMASGATLAQLVTTATVGIETLGSRSTGSFVKQTEPSNTSAAIRIVTATGRSTENLARLISAPAGSRRARTRAAALGWLHVDFVDAESASLSRARGGDVNLLAVLHGVVRKRDDPIALPQAVKNLKAVGVLGA